MSVGRLFLSNQTKKREVRQASQGGIGPFYPFVDLL
jgi:hypothetical protein